MGITLYSGSSNCNQYNFARSYIPSREGGGSFHTLMSGVALHQCARPHPREGYNYFIICHLSNINVEESGNILGCCLGNRVYFNCYNPGILMSCISSPGTSPLLYMFKYMCRYSKLDGGIKAWEWTATERNNGGVGCSGACVRKTPPDPLGARRPPYWPMTEDRSCW